MTIRNKLCDVDDLIYGIKAIDTQGGQCIPTVTKMCSTTTIIECISPRPKWIIPYLNQIAREVIMMAGLLSAILFVYIICGLFINICIMDVMKHIPSGHKHYSGAQSVIENLTEFIGFSMCVFNWPRLVHILYLGGTNE